MSWTLFVTMATGRGWEWVSHGSGEQELGSHISAGAALAQPCPGAPTQPLLPGLQGPHRGPVSAMWGQFQVQPVLPRVILALKDGSAAGAGGGSVT